MATLRYRREALSTIFSAVLWEGLWEGIFQRNADGIFEELILRKPLPALTNDQRIFFSHWAGVYAQKAACIEKKSWLIEFKELFIEAKFSSAPPSSLARCHNGHNRVTNFCLFPLNWRSQAFSGLQSSRASLELCGEMPTCSAQLISTGNTFARQRRPRKDSLKNIHTKHTLKRFSEGFHLLNVCPDDLQPATQTAGPSPGLGRAPAAPSSGGTTAPVWGTRTCHIFLVANTAWMNVGESRTAAIFFPQIPINV